MQVEIDQSGKVEQTAHDTVLAISNDIQKTIKISRRVKRQLQEMFRRKGIPKLFVLVTFSVGLYYILGYRKEPNQPTIVDTEYEGHEKAILYFLSRVTSAHETVSFGHVGTASPADRLASKVSHKLEKPTKTLSLADVWRIAQKMTETTDVVARAA